MPLFVFTGCICLLAHEHTGDGPHLNKAKAFHEVIFKLTARKPDVFIPESSSESISNNHRHDGMFEEHLSTNSATLTFLQHSEWTGCTHTQMGMMEAILSLDQLVDESDPDVDFPNSFHAFQTAEGIRQAHPDKGTIDRESDKNTHRECVR